ncbi:MAG: VanZ family protein [Planctomycetes bacterium]|nr:VanZ family protein [Planctomycetota bacterium]
MLQKTGLKLGGISEYLEPLVRRVGKRRLTLLCRVGLVLYLVALGLATHMPPRQLKRFSLHIDVPDKLAHFACYALLAVLAVIAAYSFGVVRRLRPSGWAAIVISGLLVLACLGLIDEATQPAFGRQFDWLDWTADLAGAATAATLAVAVLSLRRRSVAHT